jgi:membrane protease YdiL (CAAX protease family)
MRERDEMAACALCCLTKNVLCTAACIAVKASRRCIRWVGFRAPRADSTLLFPLGLFVGQGSFIVHPNLRNRALIPNASVSELIQFSTIIIFFVALAEELFRVILQPQLIERSSAVVGIPNTSAIFGAIHAGYANAYELLFATVSGVFFGVAFYKTRNLALIVTIHAVNNIVLFGVLGFFTHRPE